MKKLTMRARVAVLFALALSLAACAPKKTDPPKVETKTDSATVQPKAEVKLEEWKEIELFHNVMAETFHPMEEGDMKPILTRAQEMADKAKAWQTSTPPARFAGNDSIKIVLTKLVTDSQALADLVKKKGKDAQIKKDLSALHDTFHDAAHRCNQVDKKAKM
jgi:hypothetical protein